ncbi:MAG: hypothetical protein GSR73_04760 [Desulfurococcales archaeon]|nr:hypothetical protein [Desulfurococcales archaeon]
MLEREALMVVASWGEQLRRERGLVKDVAYFEAGDGSVQVVALVSSPLSGDPYLVVFKVGKDPRKGIPQVFIIPSPTKNTSGHGVYVIKRLEEPLRIGGRVYRDAAVFCPMRESEYLALVRGKDLNGFDLILHQVLRYMARCEGKGNCRVGG